MTGFRSIAFRSVASLLLVILVFPHFDIVSAVGVDNSLGWAFNHFFSTGQASYVVFPHGPLAFLMYPQALGGDLDAAFFGTVAIMGTFFFALLSLGAQADPDRFTFHLLLAALLGVVVQPQLQLVAITGAGLALHWTTRSKGWLLVAVFAALIAVHVRAGVGIIACTLLVSHAAIIGWKRREWRTILISVAGFVLGAIIMRVWLYGNLTNFGTYYLGLYELARASSAATGLHPENDWRVLVCAIVLFALIPVVYKDGRVRYLFALFGLALFAAWKHGITREDIYHARGLFIFLMLFFGLLLLLWRNPRPMAVLAVITVLILGYRGLASTLLYEELVVAPFGVQRFHLWAFDRDDMAQRATDASMRNLAVQQLPSELVARLDRGTVDVYPWEFSYIPANGLRWRPRPVLQSYASYTPWLDARNAMFFQEGNGADRILWHFNTDRWGGRMGSVDDRYLLNDEPKAIMAMLDNYAWTAGNDQVAVLERSADRLGNSTIVGSSVERWDSWIPVPETAEGILRAKVHVHGTFYRILKDFVYKDAVYIVLYQLADGRTLSYRFVPDLAAEGIWVAPFIQDPASIFTEERVVAIRFQCSEPAMVAKVLPIEWELTALSDAPGTPSTAFGLFGKYQGRSGDEQVSEMDMETSVTNWELKEELRSDSLAHSGRFAYPLPPNAFSPTFVLPLDSITGPLHVQGRAWVRAPLDAKLVLAIAMEDALGATYWEAVDVQTMLFSDTEWWHVVIERTIQPIPGHKLKVYLWNTGTVPALVDDIAVKLVPTAK